MGIKWDLKTDGCCGCTDLRTGALIMNYFSLFFTVLGIFGCIWGISNKEEYMRALQKDGQVPMPPEASLVTCLVNLLVIGTFLFGVYNKRPAWMLPEVILSVIGLFITVIVAVIVAIPTFGIALLISLPILLLQWHLTSVLYSLYKEIDAECNGNPNPGVIYVQPGAPAPNAPRYPDLKV